MADTMNNRKTDGLLARVSELPPIPQVAQKALELIRDPNSSMTELANLLVMDEALAGLVLRWVNSAYYGLSQQVSTVHQAIVYLGQRTLHSLILAASVASYLNRPAPGYALERGDLWRHSLGMAAGARLLASKFGSQAAEEAYHAGLLSDIGKLAFEVLLRNENTAAPDWNSGSFEEMEQAHFGVDHATLGAELARRWQLPLPLIDAIAHHHQPLKASEGAFLAAVVHVADAAMLMLGVGLGSDGLQYNLDPVVCERLGWSDARLEELAERVLPFIEEADGFIQNRR